MNPLGEREVRQLVDDWYKGIIYTFFDEVHTLEKCDIQLSSDDATATVNLLGEWDASRWKAPVPKSERLMMAPDQTWTIVRSAESGKAVILTYVVNSLNTAARIGRPLNFCETSVP